MSSTVTPLCLTRGRHNVFQSKLRVTHKVAEEIEIEIDVLLLFSDAPWWPITYKKLVGFLLRSLCTACFVSVQ